MMGGKREGSALDEVPDALKKKVVGSLDNESASKDFEGTMVIDRRASSNASGRGKDNKVAQRPSAHDDKIDDALKDHDNHNRRRSTRGSQKKEKHSLIQMAIEAAELKSLYKPPPKMGIFHSGPAAIRHLQANQGYNVFLLAVICVNLVVLSLEYHGMNDDMRLATYVTSIGCFCIMCFNFLLTLIGHHLKAFDDPGVMLDAVVVIATLAQLKDGSPSISALFSLRVFSMLPLPSFQNLSKSLASAFSGIVAYLLIIVLYLFVNSIVGMELFKGQFVDVQGSSFRPNFDTVYMAFLTLFQCLTPERWNEVMAFAFRSIGWGGAIYILAFYLFGFYIIMSIFSAIMLHSFTSVRAKQVLVEERQRVAEYQRKQANMGQSGDTPGLMAVDKEKEMATQAELREQQKIKATLINIHKQEEKERKEAKKQRKMSTVGDNETLLQRGTNVTLEIHKEADSNWEGLVVSKQWRSIMPHLKMQNKLRTSLSDVPYLQHDAFFLLDGDTRIRRWCHLITRHAYFRRFMLFNIFISSIALALDSPITPDNSAILISSNVLNYITTAFFIIEFFIKLIARGGFLHQEAYFTSPSHCIDFFIIINSGFEFQKMGSRTLRAMRCLRALRLTRLSVGLRNLVKDLVTMISYIGNVLLMGFFLMLSFAIIGVRYFGGNLKQCLLVPSGQLLTGLNIEQCKLVPSTVWQNPIYTGNFDHIGSAILVMFEFATHEAWTSTMYTLIDSVGPTQGPSINANLGAGFFVVVCVFVCAIFYSALFMVAVDRGVNVRTAGSLTQDQFYWLQLYQLIIENPPPRLIKMEPSSNAWRQWCYMLTIQWKFNYAMMAITMVNAVVLGMSYKGEPNGWAYFLGFINDACTWCFVAEVVIRLSGIGTQYFYSKLNWIDLFTTICSLIDFGGVSMAGGAMSNAAINPLIFRAIKLWRLPRILFHFKFTTEIMHVLGMTWRPIFDTLELMALTYFVFAVAGMNLFAGMPFRKYINDTSNFDNIIMSMVTLFRCVCVVVVCCLLLRQRCICLLAFVFFCCIVCCCVV